MRSTGQIGMKITTAQREYYRYTGESAEAEERGAGASRAEHAWARRSGEQTETTPPGEDTKKPQP